MARLSRQELRDAAAATPAGVFRIRNRATGRCLIQPSTNLPSVENRLAFALATQSYAAIDQRLVPDVKASGLGALEFSVLERLERRPGGDDAEFRAELDALAQLVRDGHDPEELY
jgi:hypothetical protein